MSNPDDIRTRMETMQAHIEAACGRAADGKFMDLSALKFEAERLCSEILRLPPPQARDFQSLIGTLIGDLDRLEQIIRAAQNRKGH